MTFNKKKDIFESLKVKLEDKIMALTEEALSQKDAATNEESKAENKYDTRGLEASYIAQAHAERIAEMKESLYFVKKTDISEFKNKIKVGDLVFLIDLETNKELYFFILAIGGLEVKFQGIKIRSLSPSSPLGKKIIGLGLEDELMLNKKEYSIESAY